MSVDVGLWLIVAVCGAGVVLALVLAVWHTRA